jgi:hypothetical protein
LVALVFGSVAALAGALAFRAHEGPRPSSASSRSALPPPQPSGNRRQPSVIAVVTPDAASVSAGPPVDPLAVPVAEARAQQPKRGRARTGEVRMPQLRSPAPEGTEAEREAGPEASARPADAGAPAATKLDLIENL